jgi:hypothetical protein
VLAELQTAVENLEIPVERDAIRDALRIRDLLTAKITDALGEFDAHELWDLDAATSLKAWLKDYGRMHSAAAFQLAKTAKVLRRLPVTRRAFADGDLSSGQVDVMVTILKDRHIDLFAEHEPKLVPFLSPMPVHKVVQAMIRWRDIADNTLLPKPDERETSTVFLSEILDGRRALKGDLDADDGQYVAAAFDVATTEDDDNEPRSPAERRADALVDIAKFYLDHHQRPVRRRHRPHVFLLAPLEAIWDETRGGEYVDGTPLSSAMLRSSLCDCGVTRIVFDAEAEILDYGREQKTVPDTLWNALVARDRRCRFPGCDRTPHYCDAHHVIWFTSGGTTSLDNLVMLCRRHHHRLHRSGWHAKLDLDGTFHVTDPNGHTRTTQPGVHQLLQ